VKHEIAKHGIKLAIKVSVIFRVIMMAMFFSTDISYAIMELKEMEELRKFEGVVDMPSELQIYEFLSRFSKEQYMNCVLRILNTLSSCRKRCRACILVDSTDITLCLNWICRKISKKLENMVFKWTYSSYRKYYIGFKLTMDVDYPGMRPITFLLHSGSPHDFRLFEPIM